MKEFYQSILNIFKSSNAPFMVYYDECRTYSEAYTCLQRFNSLLRNLNNETVVLYADKGFETYCGIFSIFLSGNTWLPISPSLPEKRIIEILQTVNPKIILTDRRLPDRVDDFVKDNHIGVHQFNSLHECEPIDFKLGEFHPQDNAYILFTSGSTGTPKGVPMTHGNYIPFIKNALEILSFGREEIFSDYHDFSFDLSIFYLFCAVLTESAFAPALQNKDKYFLLNHAIQNNVTVWSSVPSSIARIKRARPETEYNTDIKIMFLCGEPFHIDILEYCYNNLNIKNVYNFYGLTETGVENFYYKCSADDLKQFKKRGFLPIGKPLPGNSVKITDQGELLIGGPQVTSRYIGGIQRERFEEINGERYFHSGDLVEKSEDLYFCKGRMDAQVKVDGYRIELGDVEAALRRLEGVSGAVCFVDEKDHRKHIIAVLETVRSSEDGYTERLKDILPSYMVPKEIYSVENFPRNKSGKIDRVKLKEITRLVIQ
jgi:D-alanine--poly(phosphoribitol) ligase subunit 1